MGAQPDYISFEPNAREELLSQIGTFSPLERSLFQRLCESWAPLIDRDRFISQVGRSDQGIGALDRLMTKLNGAKLGLVMTGVIDKKRVPVGIVLTEKGDLSFYASLLEEETNRIVDSGDHVLPSIQVLEKMDAIPPNHHVTDADSIALATAYLEDAPVDAILRVRLLGPYHILVSAKSARTFVDAAIHWLRMSLIERGYLEEVARVMNIGIAELKQRLVEKRPDLWLDLTRSVLQERSTIAFRKNIEESDEFFQTAFLIMNFTDARMGAAKAQNENDTRVDDELTALSTEVQASPEGRMSPEDFSALLEGAQSRLVTDAGEFMRRMKDETLTPRPRRKLPTVVVLAGEYIHRNRVREVFETSRALAADRLREEYTDLLYAFMRGRAPEVAQMLASRGDIDQDVRARAESQSALLSELLSRPQLLVEAVIRDAKIRRDSISTDELKSAFSVYFDVENSELLPATELFDLDIVSIFDSAFGKLNVFRQLMLRLSGRHDSLRSNYLRRFGTRIRRGSDAEDEEGGAPRGGRTQTDGQDAPGVRTVGTGARDHEAETTTRMGKRPAVKRVPKPTIRSPRELERAWEDFDEAIHTEPPPSEDEPS